MATTNRVRLRTFLVECYAPGVTLTDVEAASHRARTACRALREAGRRVEYAGAIQVPRDELVYHLFRASNIRLVREAARQASLTFERLVESVVIDLSWNEPAGEEAVDRVGRADGTPAYVGSSPVNSWSSRSEPSLTRRVSSVRDRTPSFE